MKDTIPALLFGAIVGAMAYMISAAPMTKPEIAVERVIQIRKIPTPAPEMILPEPEPIVFSWPIDLDDYIALSSPFGERDPEQIGGYGDDYHDGVDMFGTWLARIRAIAPGKVVCHFIPPTDGIHRGHGVLGGMVVIEHVLETGEIFYSRYGHLHTTEVHEGDSIQVGTLIGRQGNTGRSPSPHLHFELWRGGVCDIPTGEIMGGELVNPLKYLAIP